MNKELLCYTKMPRETTKSFNEYISVRNLQPQERNLRKVAEHNLHKKGITPHHPEYNTLLKREHNRLKKLAEKWKWFLRFELYDNDKQLDLIQKQDTIFYTMNNVLIDIIEGLLKYANNLLADVISGTKSDGEPLAVGTKIKYTSEISIILERAYNLLCKVCGRPNDYTKIDVNGDMTLKGGVLLKTDKTMEELDQEYEDTVRGYLKDIFNENSNSDV